MTSLLAEDWRKVNDAGHEAQSQAFGRAAHEVGAEGLLTPSARVPGGINLVFFPAALVRSSMVEILGEAELERWLRKRQCTSGCINACIMPITGRVRT